MSQVRENARTGAVEAMAEYLDAHVLPLIKGYGWVAGGACRALIASHIGHHEQISDLDIFCGDVHSLAATRANLEKSATTGAWIEDASHTEYRTNIGIVDLEHAILPSPQFCVDRLHFTVASIAMDTDRNIYIHKLAYEHIQSRELALANPQVVSLKDADSLLRAALKYANKGYRMSSVETAKLLRALQQP